MTTGHCDSIGSAITVSLSKLSLDGLMYQSAERNLEAVNGERSRCLLYGILGLCPQRILPRRIQELMPRICEPFHRKLCGPR
jgi:hypothetical protein